MDTIIMSTKLTMTMKQSNMLKLSDIYNLTPNPINLKTISAVNIIVKTVTHIMDISLMMVHNQQEKDTVITVFV